MTSTMTSPAYDLLLLLYDLSDYDIIDYDSDYYCFCYYTMDHCLFL